MTEGEALRRAVVAAPDDDTPRLIYADWLDENGSPDRAAFVRAQIAAARAELFSPAARETEARAGRLLELNRDRWSRHLNGHVVGTPEFRRGFIEHVTVEAVSFERTVEAILKIEPIQSLRVIRSVESQEWVSLMPLFSSDCMRQVRKLEITSLHGFEDIEHDAFIKSSHNLDGVESLSIRGSGIRRPAWLAELFRSDALPSLQYLNVADITNLGPSLFNTLGPCTHRKLRGLNASRVKFTSNEMQGILASRCLREVEELWLAFSSLHEPGPLFHLDIGWVIPWGRLAILDLSGQELGDDAVRAIAAQRDARRLRWLGLANNKLGPDSIRHLTGANHLSLYHLDVRGNYFPAVAIKALKERFPEAVVTG